MFQKIGGQWHYFGGSLGNGGGDTNTQIPNNAHAFLKHVLYSLLYSLRNHLSINLILFRFLKHYTDLLSFGSYYPKDLKGWSKTDENESREI